MSVRRLLPFFIVLIFLSISWSSLLSSLERNHAILITLRSMQSSDPAALYLAENTLISLKDDFCDKPWLLGMVYQALGDLEGRDQARREALRCSSVYTRLVRALAPEDLHLADLAVRAHPGQAEAWFWLAKACSRRPWRNFKRKSIARTSGIR